MAARSHPRYVVDEHGRRVAVIVPVDEYEALIRGQRSDHSSKAPSFTDLVGKLEWAGDPLAVQRQLRDEW
jgi:hypothetical protein